MSRLIRSAKDDFYGIRAVKDNMLRIYKQLIQKAQTSNPDSVHDILTNVSPPTIENMLSGQRVIEQNKNRDNKYQKNFVNKPFENNRSFNGEVGQQSTDGINRAKPGEIGQIGPPEQSPMYFGDAARSQFEEIGGATSNQGIIGDQVADPSLSINQQKNSLGPDPSSTIEKQLNDNKMLGVPPRVTQKKHWQPEKNFGPQVSKRKKQKRGR